MSKEILAWEKHAADQYTLLNDIVENMNLQRHGHKLQFYYTFNPSLPYLNADGSDFSQEKLLVQLRDKGLLNFETSISSGNIVSDEMSMNATRYPRVTMLYLILKPYSINKELPILRLHEPSRLLTRNHLTNLKKTKLESDGYLHISGQSVPIYFKTHQNTYKLLSIILSNRSSRERLWRHSELESLLDRPDGLKQADKFVSNTAKNINKKIASRTSPPVIGFLVIKDRQERMDAIGRGYPSEKTINLSDRFV
jgi:hypothetical protein